MADETEIRIKDLSTSITAFRSGDVISVDGPSGTAKMSKDDLANFAAENNLKKVFLTTTNISSYNDLNNYPANSAVICSNSSLYSSVAHKPRESVFECYTFAASNNNLLQFVVVNADYFFVRKCWLGTWSTWHSLVSDTSIANRYSTTTTYKAGEKIFDFGHLLVAKKDLSAGSFSSSDWAEKNVFDADMIFINADNVAYYSDLNSFPGNTKVLCTNVSLIGSISNKPVNDQFSCYTFSSSTNVKIQFVNTYRKKIFVRACWGVAWSNWIDVSKEKEFKGENPLCTFDNILCVGDSLTWSQVYTGSGQSDQRKAKKTYPNILGGICGANSFTMASPGDTSSAAWNRWKNSFEAKTNALAIIYLGTNAGLTDTLATDAPESEPDYNEWADTNTGDYAKIVSKLKGLGYKILLIEPWAGGGGTDEALATTQAVVEQIAARFGCTYVKPFKNLDDKYHYWPNGNGVNVVHYNDLGYAWFATVLPMKVAELESDNLKFIIPD